MNRRSWILVGAAVLFAGLLLYTLQGSGPREQADAFPPETFWREDRNAVQRLEIERAGHPALVIERTTVQAGQAVSYQLPERFRGIASAPFDAFTPPAPATEWWLVGAERLPADPSQVTSLLFALAEPRPLQQVVGPEQASESGLESFGLNPPRATVRLQVTGDDGEVVTRELQLGDATPLRSSTGDAQSYYAAVPGQPGVYTFSSYPIETVFEEASALRLKQFARFEPDAAVAMRLLWDGKPPVHLTRTGEVWRLEAPDPAPADAAAVRDLLYDLDLLRAEEVVFEDASDEELAAAGLMNPRGEMLVWLEPEPGPKAEPSGGESREAPRAQVLWVGDFLRDGSGVYVRLAADRTVYRVRGERLQSFFDATARPVRLAWRSLLPPGWETAGGGSIRRVTWEDPEGTRIAERQEDGTWSGPGEMEAFLRSLESFRAAEAVASGSAALEAAGWAPGDPLPEGAQRLILEPQPSDEPSDRVVVTRLPGVEKVANQDRVRLLWTSDEGILLLRADPAQWQHLVEHW